MSNVVIYGSSDDLIEIEGNCPGCDEYNSQNATFVCVGPRGKTRLSVWYTSPGVWAIAVSPVAEGEPMLHVSFGDARKYSAQALVHDVEMVVEEAKR